MISLKDLITSVSEERLDKDQLEAYHTQISGLYASLQLEMAIVEKEKALYFEKQMATYPDSSDISIKRQWLAGARGQREIELKRYLLATKELISSLKSRIYKLL